ncbi:MAG: hypothetical protein RMK52_09880 [Chitinophagales bacterium]|nr:hypothetical protein [Chitinophagales bacterium]
MVLRFYRLFWIVFVLSLVACGRQREASSAGNQTLAAPAEARAQAAPAASAPQTETRAEPASAAEPASPVPAEPTYDNRYIRNHWQQFLEVYSPAPPEISPPGLFGYQLKVRNKFPYQLDTLVVLVSYFVGGDCIAVEPLRIHQVTSGALIFVPIPDNSHARTFRYQVRKVVCRKAELCFDIDQLYFGDDPYRCAAG